MRGRETYGLSFCLRGQITYTMDGKQYVSDPGHAVILPQGGFYSLYGDKEGMFPLINFRCENFCCDTIMVLPLQNAQTCIKDFEKMNSLFLFKENRLSIFSILYALLHKIAKEQLPQQNLLYPAMRYMEKNIADPQLSNTVLAKQVGISEVYFRKLFSTLYGCTPKQYVLDIRMQKAKQLLGDALLTVTAVAEACGFSSVYHFCRVFKERVGITPTQYAKHNKTFRI